MKAVIVYYSQTGFTCRYAQWLAEALGCDCVPFNRRTKVKLDDYDVLIFGSGLSAGKIRQLSWFKESMATREGRKKIVFAVGAMPREATEAVEKMFAQNFTSEQRKQFELFYLQGGLSYEKMSFPERLVMRMMCAVLRRKKRTPDEEGMFRMIEKSFDATDRSAIAPIVEAAGGVEDDEDTPGEKA